MCAVGIMQSSVCMLQTAAKNETPHWQICLSLLVLLGTYYKAQRLNDVQRSVSEVNQLCSAKYSRYA